MIADVATGVVEHDRSPAGSMVTTANIAVSNAATVGVGNDGFGIDYALIGRYGDGTVSVCVG